MMIAQAPKAQAGKPDPAPAWALKMFRRLAALPDGRHLLVFTKSADGCDLTEFASGKVEKLK